MPENDKKSFAEETFRENIETMLTCSQRTVSFLDRASDFFSKLDLLRRNSGGWLDYDIELVKGDNTREDLLVTTTLLNPAPNNAGSSAIHDKTRDVVVLICETPAGALSFISNMTAINPETKEPYAAPVMGVDKIISAMREIAIAQNVLFPEEVGKDGKPHLPKGKKDKGIDFMKAFGRN